MAKVQASYADFVWGLPPSTDPLYPSVGISTPEQKSGERYKVINVAKDSPAAAAGFQVGDELVSIDGVAYTDKETVNRLMAGKRWGDSVDYKVMRSGPGAGAHGAAAAAAAEAGAREGGGGRALRQGSGLELRHCLVAGLVLALATALPAAAAAGQAPAGAGPGAAPPALRLARASRARR